MRIDRYGGNLCDGSTSLSYNSLRMEHKRNNSEGIGGGLLLIKLKVVCLTKTENL